MDDMDIYIMDHQTGIGRALDSKDTTRIYRLALVTHTELRWRAPLQSLFREGALHSQLGGGIRPVCSCHERACVCIAMGAGGQPWRAISREGTHVTRLILSLDSQPRA